MPFWKESVWCSSFQAVLTLWKAQSIFCASRRFYHKVMWVSCLKIQLLGCAALLELLNGFPLNRNRSFSGNKTFQKEVSFIPSKLMSSSTRTVFANKISLLKLVFWKSNNAFKITGSSEKAFRWQLLFGLALAAFANKKSIDCAFAGIYQTIA